jgi:CHAT domain-containing protein
MTKFYTNLSQGEDVSSSLRTAQLELINSQKHQHPFYWAAFQVNGKGE